MNEAAKASDITRAAQRLLAGALVAFPTETVYGLGADAENSQAVAAIFAAKGRPADHPVIVHLAPGANLAYWAKDIPQIAHDLVKAFWPGPLTLILSRASAIPAAVSGGQDTIGLRCPSHPIAQQLLCEFAQLKGGQGGVAAPSANKFGQVSPTTASHVRSEFPELDASQLMVIEGGAAEVGIESTILDLSRIAAGGAPALLRPGHISADQIEAVIGQPVSLQAGANAPRVSGALKAHYAPHTPLRLLDRLALDVAVDDEVSRGRRVAVLAFGEPTGSMGQAMRITAMDTFNVVAPVPSPQGAAQSAARRATSYWVKACTVPDAYARHLYACLRSIDALGADQILLERPPQTEAWRAINDRVSRAAAAFGE